MTGASLRSVASAGSTSPATISYAVVGVGPPVTIFVPGLGGGVEDTRPLAGGLTGTRVFVLPRSHGTSTPAHSDVTYADLAADVLSVADAVAATQGLGVSLGAATLAHLLSRHPDRFTAAAFYLPAAFGSPRRPTVLLEALSAGADETELPDVLAEDLPAEVRRTPEVRRWSATRAHRLVQPGVLELGGLVGREAPVPRPADLAAVSTRCLVVGCEHDPSHPAEVARDLSTALPGSRLRVFADPAPLWTARAEVRSLLAATLGADS